MCNHVLACTAGHGQAFGAYCDFLMNNLTMNQLKSPALIALDHTKVFFPSDVLTVPTGDTVGSGDADPLNAARTQDAVDEAIRTSSQLVLLVGKNLKSEDNLTQHIIPYCRHILTTLDSKPAIHCMLLPDEPRSVYQPTELLQFENTDRQREAISMEQLSVCLHIANDSLEQDQKRPEQRLQEIINERFVAQVVYLRTLASWCQAPAAVLEELAFQAGVTREQLLESTNGLWLLGNSLHPFKALPL